MKLPSIADTISFKLSALYLILFLCSFLSIGITVYLLTYHTLEQQLKSSVETEAVRLKTEYDSGGIAELRDEIDEVDGRVSHTLLEYGVIDQNGKLIAGSFNNFQPSEGWQTVMRTPAANKPEKEGKEFLYIRVMALPNNVWMGVGHDGEYIQNAGQAIIQAFIWGFVLVIFLGAGGGLSRYHLPTFAPFWQGAVSGSCFFSVVGLLCRVSTVYSLSCALAFKLFCFFCVELCVEKKQMCLQMCWRS